MDNETFNDLRNWEDWRLSESVAYHEREIEIAQGILEHFQKGLTDIQKEIDRRALAAYWKANPTLTPLVVGDKLLVTDALFDLREREGGWPKRGSHIKIGSICEIYQYDSVVKDCWFVKFSGSTAGLIPTDIIQDMRRAYLATVNGSKP